ncbi:MAG: alkaline phosphatase family protein [Woeseiaceae bacterium]|nr:alkaline phosphatase family protein [Woeseiaceae bacterium]
MFRIVTLSVLLCPLLAIAAPRTENVILVTLDGVRIEELFAGMDPAIAASTAEDGYSDIEIARERYWRGTAAERRMALMPFFWGTLVPQGIVLGNPELGSRVKVGNAIKWSSPGYVEIMTGAPQAEVVDNTLVRYPHRTITEYIRGELLLAPSKVAQFGSWDGFKVAAASMDDAFVMNGAYEALPPELSTPDMDLFVALRRDIQGLWEESSNDVLTFRLAQSYLLRHKPRFLWLGLGQSDDWAHAARYDRLLDYLHLSDRLLSELWATLQADETYRERTTLIITTDHGRGRGPADWMEHDESIPGSEDIWIAVIGPDTPATGEAGPLPTVHQGDVAATIARLLQLDPEDFNPQAGPPIDAVWGTGDPEVTASAGPD